MAAMAVHPSNHVSVDRTILKILYLFFPGQSPGNSSSHFHPSLVQMAAMKRAAGGRPALVQALQDSLKDEYEDFDDFIEMSIQFGCAAQSSLQLGTRR